MILFQAHFLIMMSFHPSLISEAELGFWNVLLNGGPSLGFQQHPLLTLMKPQAFTGSMSSDWTHYDITSGVLQKAPGEFLLTSLLTRPPHQPVKLI